MKRQEFTYFFIKIKPLKCQKKLPTTCILKSVTCLFLLPALVASIRVSCLFLKVGFRKCGAKIHGDSVPEKPNPPDLHQYRPETSLATGGIWEEKLSGPNHSLTHPPPQTHRKRRKQLVNFSRLLIQWARGGTVLLPMPRQN